MDDFENPKVRRLRTHTSRSPQFAIQVNPAGSTFVKEYDFFVSQGGLKEAWGKHWKIIEAPDMQGARMIALHLAEARHDFGLYCGSCGAEKHVGVCKSPRCKRCGKPRREGQVFCGAGCAARHEAHEQIGEERDEHAEHLFVG